MSFCLSTSPYVWLCRMTALLLLLFHCTNGLLNTKDHRPFDFIFGFSTGHVGTTTLSDAGTYNHPHNVQFLHEMLVNPAEPDPLSTWQKLRFAFTQRHMTTSKWQKSSYHEEYDYVKSVFIPFLLASRGSKATLLDLGHNINYFYKALASYLSRETKYRFLFVHIVRERHEAAISLATQSAFHVRTATDLTAQGKLCDDLSYRFCPFDRPKEVQVRIPGGKSMWDSFTWFQQALWMLDEIEARFQDFTTEFPAVETIEIVWGKQYAGSLEKSAVVIGHLLGEAANATLQSSSSTSSFSPPPQEKVHAGEQSKDADLLYAVALQDEQYKSAVGRICGVGSSVGSGK